MSPVLAEQRVASKLDSSRHVDDNYVSNDASCWTDAATVKASNCSRGSPKFPARLLLVVVPFLAPSPPTRVAIRNRKVLL